MAWPGELFIIIIYNPSQNKNFTYTNRIQKWKRQKNVFCATITVCLFSLYIKKRKQKRRIFKCNLCLQHSPSMVYIMYEWRVVKTKQWSMFKKSKENIKANKNARRVFFYLCLYICSVVSAEGEGVKFFDYTQFELNWIEQKHEPHIY
jgi:hypothetical protein